MLSHQRNACGFIKVNLMWDTHFWLVQGFHIKVTTEDILITSKGVIEQYSWVWKGSSRPCGLIGTLRNNEQVANRWTLLCIILQRQRSLHFPMYLYTYTRWNVIFFRAMRLCCRSIKLLLFAFQRQCFAVWKECLYLKSWQVFWMKWMNDGFDDEHSFIVHHFSYWHYAWEKWVTNNHGVA